MNGGLAGRFAKLWAAFSLSNLGDGFVLVGFPLLAASVTEDARLVALVAASQVVPFLLVGLPAGVLIDRFDRRRLAMGAQAVRAACLIGVAIPAWRGAASITILVVAGFVAGVAEILIDGGLPAVVRDLVATSDLEAANARLRISETVANGFIGPPVAGLVFIWQPALPVLFAAASYLVSLLLLGALRGSFVAEQIEEQQGLVARVRSGLVYVWRHPVLRPLALAVAAFAFAGTATNAVFVLLVTERLGFSEAQYGVLLAVDSFASVGCALLVTRLVKRTSHGASMRLAVVCYTAQALVLGIFTLVPIVVFAMLLGGASDPTWNVVSATVRQRLIDDALFGRVMTAYLFIAWGLMPVGALVGGTIAEQFGPETVFLMSAVIVGSLLVWAQPLFRRVNQAMATA